MTGSPFAMFPNVPGPTYRAAGPGARKLREAVFVVFDQIAQYRRASTERHLDNTISRPAAIASLFAPMLVSVLFGALQLARNTAFADAILGLDPREAIFLATGVVLFRGWFDVGTSIA
jgi:hypothetical protein